MGNCCVSRERDTQFLQPEMLEKLRIEDLKFGVTEEEQKASTQQAIKDAQMFVQSVIEKGEPWTDNDFPTQLSSLFDD